VHQDVHFTASADGARIAYALTGSGPPLVKTANWLNHLEFDLQSPVWRHWLRELSRDHRLVRYDERGCGMSDADAGSAGLEAWVADLEAVVDAAGLDRFPLLGISQGGPVAIAYATRHPERVTKLILYGTYARGWARRGASQQELDEREAMLTLTRLGWGRDLPAYREPFTQTFIPGATDEQRDWFNELQRITCSPENAVALQRAMGEIDIEALLPQVRVPALVLHARGDMRCSFEEGRRLAGKIPDSRFVALEGNNHLLLESEPAWPIFLREVRAFLGVSVEPSAPVDALRESLERSLGGASSITRELGGGGMARVFVARDQQLDRDIVVKVLHADLAEGLSTERFTREMKLAASLQHPNIVPVLGAGATRSGLPWYTMPFIPGESLRARLTNPLPLDEALAILRDVAAALAYAHQAGIVHRDIKPENILLSAGTAMVADFGIARAMVDAAASPAADAVTVEARLTRAGTLLGTPAYMAPEQAGGESVGPSADVYSWGMVAYEAITGAHPFAGKTNAQQLIVAHMTETPSHIDGGRNAPPAPIASLVMQCVEKDPDRRPRTGRELFDALNARHQ
jgi:pimeloyl-ACP methyl ester carboxylesterase/tRNA A-37 threonylcarbamoyl transferase component Bud32